jgi:hypothetical protein
LRQSKCKDYKDSLGANRIKILESLFAIFCSESNTRGSNFILLFFSNLLSTSKDCVVYIHISLLSILHYLWVPNHKLPFSQRQAKEARNKKRKQRIQSKVVF